MIPLVQRQRSTGELAFGLLKTLLCGYRIWGTKSSLRLAGLADSLRTSDTRVIGVVAYLAAEGLVTLDQRGGIIRLTEKGAGNLLGEPCPDCHGGP